MKKFLLSFYVMVLVLTFVSCKENNTETSLETDESHDTLEEENETPVLEELDVTEVDTTSIL